MQALFRIGHDTLVMRLRLPTSWLERRFGLAPIKVSAPIADSGNMDASSIALQGLQQANTELDAAAAAISAAGATSANGSHPDVVDLSSAMVALMSAQTSFSSNLATLETADQLQKTLLDVTA